MELIFAPLVIVALFWKEKTIEEFFITLLFLVYAISLFFFVDLPKNSRIGSLFIGIPSISYLTFIFPSLIQYEEKVVKTTSVIMIVITSLLLLYFQLLIY